MSYIRKITHPMHQRQRNLDQRKAARKSFLARHPEVPTLLWLVVGVLAFVALILALTSR